jgi:hypothetical protein
MAVSGAVAGGAAAAALVGIYADLAYNTYSATNSSPQTTELFAGDRADTLWKYVKLGHAQALVIGVFGSWLARSLWPLFGVVIVAVIMHGMYSHAVEAGKDQAPPEGASPYQGSGGSSALRSVSG